MADPTTPSPAYPAPGSQIPGQLGYVVGVCGHRVATQEWRAGCRTCERCGHDGQDVPPAEPITARLNQIQERVQLAAPGPWKLHDDNADDGFPRPRWVVQGPDDEPDDWQAELLVNDPATGEFIAHARQDVPNLLEELKAAEETLAKVTRHRDHLYDRVQQQDKEIKGRKEYGQQLRRKRDQLGEQLAEAVRERCAARAEAGRWQATYQEAANATDAFLTELLELLLGATETGVDAYDQIPAAIERLRAASREGKAGL